jgi:hypothetical protein
MGLVGRGLAYLKGRVAAAAAVRCATEASRSVTRTKKASALVRLARVDECRMRLAVRRLALTYLRDEVSSARVGVCPPGACHAQCVSGAGRCAVHKLKLR